MARLKSAWDKLSMRDRALFIRLGVLNGIYDIRAIKGVYNEYHDEDSKENYDYNMAAAIATGFGPDQNKHWPDTFKKSNHPTFSVESIYSTKETPGGTWGPNFKTFEPSDWMINTYGSTPTIEYLLKHDPDVTPVYMGGVLLPEITVTANRFNNDGNLAHKYDGELILEDLKMAFLQDWAYRYNNEAPTDTTTVVNAHNSVPLTIDDSILKQGLGGKYNPDTGVTLGRDTFNDIYAHEFSHALRRNIAGGLNSTTKENKELLNQAYPRFTVPLEKIIPSVITTEQLATNTEYRSEISKRAGNLWGKELDTYIDNMSQAELLAGVGTNGYIFGQNVPFTRTSYIGREATRKLLEEYRSLLDITDEQKLKEWYGYTLEDRHNRIKELELEFESGFTEEDRQQAEALRKALKTIAYNTTNPFEVSNNTYLAAFGGLLNHKKSGEELGESSYIQVPSTTQTVTPIYMNPLPYKYTPRLYDSGTITIDKTANIKDMLLLFNDSPFMGITRLVDPTGLVSVPDAIIDLKLLYDTPTTERTVYDYVNGLASVASVIPGGSFVGDVIKVDNWKQGLDLAQQTLEKTFIPKLINWALDSKEYHDRKNKKSTGGPLYPFSFEKNPFLKTPAVRYDEGGQKQNASNPGGYTDNQLDKNYLIWKSYDPTGGLGIINYLVSQNTGNLARGEENEYWKEYLGLHSAVPTMNPNAHTEWDKQIEGEKKQNEELTSDFYGTTPRMDYNILALADTLMLGDMVRNYTEYDKTYDLPHIETITEAYELAKNILNNPNQWTYVNGEIPIGRYRYDSKTSETNPLGMLSHFGMKWVPEENALYMHDTYDFPTRVHRLTDIPVRPREMKIRSRINFDPTKGSWLLRNPVNYNADIPIKVTK